jgi:hypothetical protein
VSSWVVSGSVPLRAAQWQGQMQLAQQLPMCQLLLMLKQQQSGVALPL